MEAFVVIRIVVDRLLAGASFNPQMAYFWLQILFVFDYRGAVTPVNVLMP